MRRKQCLISTLIGKVWRQVHRPQPEEELIDELLWRPEWVKPRSKPVIDRATAEMKVKKSQLIGVTESGFKHCRLRVLV